MRSFVRCMSVATRAIALTDPWAIQSILWLMSALCSTASESDSAQCWPDDELEAVPACPVCDGTERKLVYAGLRDRVFRCAPGEWSLYRCGDCGAGYLNPRPTRATIGRAYLRYWTHAPVGGLTGGRPPRGG